MFYPLFKQLAFLFDPESAHCKTLQLASRFPQLASVFAHPSLKDVNRYQIAVGPCTWPFPVGLAAGLDKNAQAIAFFSRLLFGAIEVGTVTPQPQPGNPRPRLFRLKPASLRNQMGFNNLGMEGVLRNIIATPANDRCLGINLGKNRWTPPQQTAADYCALYQKFAPIADYLVINISSPNTPGLRKLQQGVELANIVQALAGARKRHPCPLWVKVSPDLALPTINEILQVADHYHLAGLIATNSAVCDDYGPGGISGQLLFDQARNLRSRLLRCLEKYPRLHLIGVGGFASFDQIKAYWMEGGGAVQLYTSFIYQGPQLLVDIKRGIDHMLDHAGVASLGQWFEQRKIPPHSLLK